jgi:tripartite ATP-independent transporter DctP family solute receptor
MKKVLFTVVAAALVFAGCQKKEAAPAAGAAAAAPAAATVTIKFANVTPQAPIAAGEKFKADVEKASNGTIEVQHFPSNQLGDDLPSVKAAIVGDIDIAVTSTSSIAELYKDLYMFDSPYLFLSRPDAYAKLDGPAGQKALAGMEKIGLKGLAFWENGFRNLTNNKIPVKLPDQVKGMKIRVMSNDVHIAIWKAFGANPTPMAYGELFTALQQGTVDAEENPLTQIDAGNFQTVQKYISRTEHVYTPFLVVMNLKKYNSLSADQKAIIDKCIKDACDWERTENASLDDKVIAKWGSANEVISLTEAEKSQWRQKALDAKVFDLVKTKMENPGLLDEMLK